MPMTIIHGSIDEVQVSTFKGMDVRRLGPNQFLIKEDSRYSEIFFTSRSQFSDGNVIDDLDVQTESARERLVKERFGNVTFAGKQRDGSGKMLKAPMPGMVRAISVVVGESVTRSTQVIVLEAMKMENSITAGRSGVISKILASVGSSVEKNTPLIEIV